MRHPKTVMLYFLDKSHPNSLRIVQDPTSQIRGIYFTKSQLKKVASLSHANHHAVYFLFSNDDSSVYIGKSINGIERLRDHLREKEFWQFAILFVTDNNSFDVLSIDYLEHYFIHAFSNTQYRLENKDLRVAKPNVTIFNEATLESFAAHIQFLLEAIGISFKALEASSGDIEHNDLFHAKEPFKASILLVDGKFVLQAGSIIKMPVEKTLEWMDKGAFHRKYVGKFEQLIEMEKALRINDTTAKLLEHIEFNKPSMPAELCSGSAQNGWLFWKGLNERRRAER